MANDSKQEWTGKSRGGSLGTWFFVFTLRHLGVRSAYVLLFFVVPYFVLFAPKASKAIYKYYRSIVGKGRLRSFFLIFSHFYTFGQTLIDKIALKHGLNSSFTFDYGQNYQDFLKTLDRGCGAIIISAHVGSWEIGAPYLFDYGKRINIVMLDAEYSKIKHVIEKGAEKADFKVIPLGSDGLESIIRIKNALDQHEYVCFQGDRYMNDSNTIERDFMNRKALFPKGLFKLAVKMRVPVIFYFAMREPRRHYRFIFHIADTDFTGRSADGYEILINQYIKKLEEIVKEYPKQWFNFYNFWLK